MPSRSTWIGNLVLEPDPQNVPPGQQERPRVNLEPGNPPVAATASNAAAHSGTADAGDGNHDRALVPYQNERGDAR